MTKTNFSFIARKSPEINVNMPHTAKMGHVFVRIFPSTMGAQAGRFRRYRTFVSVKKIFEKIEKPLDICIIECYTRIIKTAHQRMNLEKSILSLWRGRYRVRDTTFPQISVYTLTGAAKGNG